MYKRPEKAHTLFPPLVQKSLKPSSIQDAFGGFLRDLKSYTLNVEPKSCTKFSSSYTPCGQLCSPLFLRKHHRSGQAGSRVTGDCAIWRKQTKQMETQRLSTAPKGADGCLTSLHRVGDATVAIYFFSDGRVTLLSFTCSLHDPSVRRPVFPKSWANPAAPPPLGLPTYKQGCLQTERWEEA